MVTPTQIRVGPAELDEGLHVHVTPHTLHTGHGVVVLPYPPRRFEPTDAMPIDGIVFASSAGAVVAWHLLRHRGRRSYRLPE